MIPSFSSFFDVFFCISFFTSHGKIGAQINDERVRERNINDHPSRHSNTIKTVTFLYRFTDFLDVVMAKNNENKTKYFFFNFSMSKLI